MMLISIFGLSSSSLSDAASLLTVAFVAFYATEYSLFTVKALDSDVGPSSGIQVQWSCFNIAKLVWWLHRVSAILGFCAISLTTAALVFKYNHPDDLIGDTSAYYFSALAVVVGAISISFASDIVELRVCRRHCDRSESGAAAAALVDSEAASDSGSDSGPEADAAEIAPLTAPRAGEFCVAARIACYIARMTALRRTDQAIHFLESLDPELVRVSTRVN